MKLSLPTNINQPVALRDDRPRHNLLRFPQTDCYFHSSTMGGVSVRAERPTVGTAELRAFRQMNSTLLKEESRSGILIETLVFALVAGVIAWALISLVIVLVQTARG